jgi:glycogen operon protein
MILAGDELGRSQQGNNNAYCQDNEITWVDWTLEPRQRMLLTFAQRVFAIRRANPVLRRRGFFRGRPIGDGGMKDIAWIRPDGEEMGEADWNEPGNHVLGMIVHGQATDEVDERGRLISGNTLLLLTNAGSRSRSFTLPRLEEPGTWCELINTVRGGTHPVKADEVQLAAFSLVLLCYESGT